VYPAHGPGSSCGKNLGPNTHSTIGEQKATNYALQPQTKEEFIKAVTTGLALAPVYFPINAKINQTGYEEIDEVVKKGTTQLSVDEFKNWIKEDAIILDTRPASIFTHGFIPGSIFIGLEGRFAEWSGTILPFDKPIILVTELDKETESVIRLSRVGFENICGVLAGGFEKWKSQNEPVDIIIDVEADELMMDIPFDKNLEIIDVRKENEFADGHLENALNLPLHEITNLAEIAQFEEQQNLYIHCAGGYRSVIAASLFKRQGVHNLRNVLGGWSSIRNQPTAKILKVNAIVE
jgi:rhodanese-related sulfurtransferase